MQDGKVSLPYKRFLGYAKGEDGKPEIIESEAETVRLIYKMYLNGHTVTHIAAHLMERGVLTPGGKKKWTTTTLFSILQNEKYAGQARLQKGFTVSFLTKERKKNEGELSSYWVDNSQPAIVPVEVYDLVQAEIARHKAIGTARSGVHPFSSMVFCGECSGVFGSKNMAIHKQQIQTHSLAVQRKIQGQGINQLPYAASDHRAA